MRKIGKNRIVCNTELPCFSSPNDRSAVGASKIDRKFETLTTMSGVRVGRANEE